LRPRDDVQLHVYEGKNQLRLELRTLREIEGFDRLERIAIVRDADQDPKAALQSVLSQWAAAFNRRAPRVSSDQWFDDGEGKQWSVWIMPAPDATGDLEELLWRTVELSGHRTCIGALMNCLGECQPVPFAKDTKARLYAWLSTQRDPVKELHAAFRPHTRLFDPASEPFA